MDIVDWINKLETLGRALRNGQISALAWQDSMNDLYHHVSIDALLNCIEIKKVIDMPGLNFEDQQNNFVEVQFRPDQGFPENRAVTTKIAKIKKGCSILPHGHLNMVSAFLTLSGEFHVRNYDRLYFDEKFFHIRLASDNYSKRGQWNSQSEDRSNVHWLTATTDDTYLFSAKVEAIDSGVPWPSSLYVDPHGKDLGNGIIQAERITYERAHELYG